MKWITVLLITLCHDSVSWDGIGHKIVSRIASRLMSKKSGRYVRQTLREDLGTYSFSASKLMSAVSSWADVVSDELTWSKELHYANIPSEPHDGVCSGFDLRRDCESRRCIVTAVSNYTMRALDINQPVSQRAEALKFLIHLVADIHQPLHLGFEGDAGGARIGLESPEDHSLHQVWDSYLVDAMIRRLPGPDSQTWYDTAAVLADDFLNDQEILDVHNDPALARFPSDHRVVEWATRIASETVRSHTCRSAYKNEFGQWVDSGSSLSENYISTRARVVREQLLRAGVRLARLLDSISDSFFEAQRVAESAAFVESLGTRNAVPVAINPFAGLDFNFELDVDDLLYEIGVDDDEEEIDGHIEARPAITQTATGPVVTTSTRSPEERKRESAKKKRMRVKVNKRRLFGVDIESLVLIKRRGNYYITDVKLVTSESYLPSLFSLVLVKFGTQDDPTPFLLDSGVFHGETRIELLRAVFKKLKGMDYSAEVAAANDAVVEPTMFPLGEDEIASISVVGRSELTAKQKVEILDQIADAEALLLAKLNINYSFGKADISTVADLLRPRPTKAELKRMYGGVLPTEEQRVGDILDSQWGDLVIINLGKITVLSRKDLLLDKSNRRWVFNRHFIINPEKSLTEKSLMYVDVRVLDEPYTNALASNLSRLGKSRQYRDVVRDVIARGSPILDRLQVQSDQLIGKPGAHAAGVVAFKSVRVMDREGPNFATIEYIMREPEDERRVAILLQVSGIPKLVTDGLKSPAGARLRITQGNRSR